ncbi:TcdA/TcdB catalytic glycosyltransferase domain-containing protein [Fluviispira vulneris]|uniref:TcdA/TcdB catalytic glycosyltransferase domain-containing protein n=1 Tax=Fluviispira vulneris TaxID=2763012 RepID=UPI00164535C7|nr:TcdA/TcdB catalytic glycosyltransferase domain-containing protein [Fluviispira vulneris]
MKFFKSKAKSSINKTDEIAQKIEESKNVFVNDDNVIKNEKDKLLSVLTSYKDKLLNHELTGEIEYEYLTDMLKYTYYGDTFGNNIEFKELRAYFYKAYLELSNEILGEGIPHNIHMVWLGGPLGQAQKDYLKIWGSINKRYSVYVWYDSAASFVYQTRQFIIKYFQKNFPQDFPDNFLQVQDEIYKHVLEDSDFFNYVHNEENEIINSPNIRLKNFLIKKFNTEEERFEIEKLFDENQKKFESMFDASNYNDLSDPNNSLSNIYFRDVGDLVSKSSIKEYYTREIYLRMIFAAASDMLRLEILNSVGGIYIDFDVLPKIQENISISHKLNTLKIQIAEGHENERKMNAIDLHYILKRNHLLKNSLESNKDDNAELLPELKRLIDQKNKDLVKEVNRLKEQYKDNPSYLEQIKDLTSIESLIPQNIQELELEQIFKPLPKNLGEFSPGLKVVNNRIVIQSAAGNSIIIANKDNSIISNLLSQIALNYKFLLDRLDGKSGFLDEIEEIRANREKQLKLLQEKKLLIEEIDSKKSMLSELIKESNEFNSHEIRTLKSEIENKIIKLNAFEASESTLSYRYDSLKENERNTMVISGPSVISKLMDLRFMTTELVPTLTFYLSDYFTLGSEEDLISSWAQVATITNSDPHTTKIQGHC